jgi:hypothetical protein
MSFILEYKAKTTNTTLSIRFKIHMKIHWFSTLLTMWYLLFLPCTPVSFYEKRVYGDTHSIQVSSKVSKSLKRMLKLSFYIVLLMCRRCLNHSTKFWEKWEKLITFYKVVQSQNFFQAFIYWGPSNNFTSLLRTWLFVFFFNSIKYFGFNTLWKLL